MSVKRPRRRNYESEPAYLNACLRYLDAKYPRRDQIRKRIAAWQRWEIERDDEPDVARLRELVALDDLTDDEAAELARLSTEYVEWRRTTNPRHDKKETKK